LDFADLFILICYPLDGMLTNYIE